MGEDVKVETQRRRPGGSDGRDGSGHHETPDAGHRGAHLVTTLVQRVWVELQHRQIICCPLLVSIPCSVNVLRP